VASLLERAMRHRAVGATALNEHSSRSHMVFMLSISGRNAASGQTVSGAPDWPALGTLGLLHHGMAWTYGSAALRASKGHTMEAVCILCIMQPIRGGRNVACL
jgi:Kinesin motor domain